MTATRQPDDVAQKFVQVISDKLSQDLMDATGISPEPTAPINFEEQLEQIRKQFMAERGPQIRLTVIHPDDWDEMVTMMTEVGDIIIPFGGYEDDGWRYQLIHVYENGWPHIIDLCVLDSATKGEYVLIAETSTWYFGRKP